MKYLVGLKSELDLLDENKAKQRYLEMLASGYKDNEVFVAAPVAVTSDVTFGNLQTANDTRNSENPKSPGTKLDEIPLNPS